MIIDYRMDLPDNLPAARGQNLAAHAGHPDVAREFQGSPTSEERLPH
jgi:hypothetical protein